MQTLELDLNTTLRSLRAWRRASCDRVVAAYQDGHVDLFSYVRGCRCVSHFDSAEAALAAVAAGTLRWKPVVVEQGAASWQRGKARHARGAIY